MAVSLNLIRGTYDAVIRPSELVRVRNVHLERAIRKQISQFYELAVVYFVNLGLYAGSLTVAGHGREVELPRPQWIEYLGGSENWSLLANFILNSLYLFTATVLVVVVFHGSLVLMQKSKGVFRTAYAVIYSTSAYLAGMFTIVWYISTAEGLTVTRNVVLSLQARFVYAIFDAANVSLTIDGGRPDSIEFTQLSDQGLWILCLLIVVAAYFLYSLYLGARINHGTTRLEGLIVLLAVALSPAIYVILSIILYTVPTIPTI